MARVGSLLRKERLKAEPDVQLLEDVICLVFIEHYLAGFAPRQGEARRPSTGCSARRGARCRKTGAERRVTRRWGATPLIGLRTVIECAVKGAIPQRVRIPPGNCRSSR